MCCSPTFWGYKDFFFCYVGFSLTEVTFPSFKYTISTLTWTQFYRKWKVSRLCIGKQLLHTHTYMSTHMHTCTRNIGMCASKSLVHFEGFEFQFHYINKFSRTECCLIFTTMLIWKFKVVYSISGLKIDEILDCPDIFYNSLLAFLKVLLLAQKFFCPNQSFILSEE